MVETMNQSGNDILAQLMKNSDTKLNQIQGRVSRNNTTDVLATINSLQGQIDEAANIRDAKEKDIKTKILEAKLEEVRKGFKQEETDLAQVMYAFELDMVNIDKSYASLRQEPEEAKQVIANAEQKLRDAEAQLAKAQSAWFFKGTKIGKANEAIADAKAGMEQAKVEAEQIHRNKLVNASIEEAVQNLQVKAEKIKQLMIDRSKKVEAQLASVKEGKKICLDKKEKAAKAIEKFDADLAAQEENLKVEQEKIKDYLNGSSEHAAQEKVISNLKALVEQIRVNRNTALTIFQENEKFAKRFEVDEMTQMKLKGNLAMWIAALNEDTEARTRAFSSLLEAMKACSDLEIAKKIDQIGNEADQRGAEIMAQIQVATDRDRLERMKQHPKRLKDMIAVYEAQMVGHARTIMDEAQILAEFKKNYGVDPSLSFHSSYVETEPAAQK